MGAFSSRVQDSSWVRRSFLTPSGAQDEKVQRDIHYTTAYSKYVDTRVGGHWAVNPPPQFTHYADLPVTGRNNNPSGRDSSGGMGLNYSEGIDDHLQLVHFRFGVPEFNGMVTFFTGFFDNSASYVARTGRYPGFLYRVGQGLGLLIGLRYAAPFILGGLAIRFLSNSPASKYYYLKPTMPVYWNRVQMFMNMFAVELKMVKPFYDFGSSGIREPMLADMEGDYPEYSDDDRALMHRFLPDIFRKDGTMDVYMMSTRAQRIANVEHVYLKRQIESATSAEELVAKLDRYHYDPDQLLFTDPGGKSFEEVIKLWMDSDAGRSSQDSEGANQFAETGSRPQVTSLTPVNSDKGSVWESISGWFSTYGKQAKAELEDGGQFVTFAVDNLGTITDTFSNSTGESAMAGFLNNASSTARSARFAFSDGATGIRMVDAAINSVRELASGALAGIQMSGFFSLYGSSFVDVPHDWKSSNATIHSPVYRMQLRSPTGDVLSRLINLYYPLSCILAGALPMSTGKASYTQPFVCEFYHKGFAQSRLAMITNLSVVSGAGALGWERGNIPLGFDVTWTVTPLTSIVHAPLMAYSSPFNPFAGLFGDPDEFGDLVSRYSSRPFEDQVYASRRLLINITRKLTELNSWWSVSHFITAASGSRPGRMVSGIFFRTTDRYD